MSIELVIPSNHLIFCHPLPFPPSSFPASGSFLMSRLFAVELQLQHQSFHWIFRIRFPLGLIGLISLQSKGLSKVSNTTVQKQQFFGAQPSLWSNSLIQLDLCVLSRSVVSYSLRTHGLSVDFSMQEYKSGLPFPFPVRLVSTIFATVFHLLSVIFVPIFVFYSFLVLMEHFIWFMFLSFVSISAFSFFCVCVSFRFFSVHSQLIQIHFQKTSYWFTGSINSL